MPLVELSLPPEAESDPAYPTTSTPDPVYPCQTLRVLSPPLDEIATPSMWSCLQGPLAGALDELWQRLGLLERCRPERWVTLHFGRIAINAHGWERLRALQEGVEPDPALVQPPARGMQGLPERWERARVLWCRSRLRARLRRAGGLRERGLRPADRSDPGELDTAELARGPLGDPVWREILLAGLGMCLTEQNQEDPVLLEAIALERRHGAELGRRLMQRGVLQAPAEVAYLTVDERIRAVHESSPYWGQLASSRRQRVDSFIGLEVPEEFWGRPRVEVEQTG